MHHVGAVTVTAIQLDLRSSIKYRGSCFLEDLHWRGIIQRVCMLEVVGRNDPRIVIN